MAGKSNGLESTDWARAPPPRGSFCERVVKAIYDQEEKTFLGRTAKRWGIVLAFYLVFYAVLAVLFAICMAGLYSVLEDKKPTFILDSSLIGTNPGVASRPRVLYINSSNFQDYIDHLQNFLKPYENETWFTSNDQCTKEDNYGFPNSPCLFIKVNRIYGWEPDYFTASDLPADMPDDLATIIKEGPEPQQVWISCWEEGSNTTRIEYPWRRGLPRRFYPFRSEIGYLSPLVPVKLTPGNDAVMIRCRAWAKNIIYNKSLKEPSGYVRIFLKIVKNDTESITSE